MAFPLFEENCLDNFSCGPKFGPSLGSPGEVSIPGTVSLCREAVPFSDSSHNALMSFIRVTCTIHGVDTPAESLKKQGKGIPR